LRDEGTRRSWFMKIVEGQLPGFPVQIYVSWILFKDWIGEPASSLVKNGQRLWNVHLPGKILAALLVKLRLDVRGQRFGQGQGTPTNDYISRVDSDATGKQQQTADCHNIVTRFWIRANAYP